MSSRVSLGNTTTDTLAGDAIFTGVAENVTGYEQISITVSSDVASAEKGLLVEFGPDGTNWNFYYYTEYIPSAEYVEYYDVKEKYVRIVYTNGSVAQSSFSLSTSYLTFNPDLIEFKDKHVDAFSRLRVSNPQTILEGDHTNGDNDLKFTQLLTGSATGTSITAESTHELATFADGDDAIYQTRRRALYQPGKSMLVVFTGVLDADVYGNESDVTTLFGLFDDNDGYMFAYNNLSMAIIERSSTIGETIVYQSSWNIDTADGYGNSGFIMDPTKTQIFFFDFEWLGVGRVRAGVFRSGKPIILHEFIHANTYTKPYLQTPNLPIRLQLSASGSNVIGLAKFICCTVMSEGGFNPIGRPFTYHSGVGISVDNSADYPLLALRLRSGYNTAVRLKGASFLCSSTGNIRFFIQLFLGSDPTTNGTWTNFNATNSVLQYKTFHTTETSTSAGLNVYQGYVSATGGVTNTPTFDREIFLGRAASGTSDTIVVFGRSTASQTETVFATLYWEEMW